MSDRAVRSVTTNQDGPYKNLEAVVRKYAATTFLRPVADHTRLAFAEAEEQVCKFYRDKAPGKKGYPLVLDSGCGTGMSTLHLAKKFPDIPVIGIDKSAVRLTKADQEKAPANAFWIRAELLDFWRLALEKVQSGEWEILHHALYYPNPWPKESEATRRFHLHPIFPALLQLSPVTELRTNWEIYAREFAEAAAVAGDALAMKLECQLECFEPTTPETAFERKYRDAGQKLYKVTVNRP